MMPMIAPSVLNVAASTRNWLRMSRRRAPSDLRMPISRVRSATATSMIFMMTIPPTTKPIAGRAVPAIVITLLVFSNITSADAVVSITKLSGCDGRRWRLARSASRTVSIDSSSMSVFAACTSTPSTSPRGLVSRRIGELNGAIAVLSRDWPNRFP